MKPFSLLNDRRLRRRILVALQVALSFGILLYLFTLFDWERASTVLVKLQWRYVWPAPLLLLAALFPTALRWKLLLEQFSIGIPYAQALIFYAIGYYYGILLPGILGGDVIRMGLCATNRRAPLSDVAATAVIERIFGLLTVLFLGCSGAFLLSDRISTNLGRPVISTLLVVSFGALLALLVGYCIVQYFPLTKPKGATGWRRWLAKLIHVYTVVRSIPLRTLSFVVVLSGLAQILDIVASYFIARSINIDLPFSFFLVAIPIVYLGTVLPITLGGLGIREGILLALLTRVGELPSDAIVLASLLYFNRILVAAVGGIAQLLSSGYVVSARAE